MGNKYSKGTTSISDTSYRVPFARGRFPFVALQEACNNFDEKFVIAKTGFGKVYRGVLCDGTKVALQRSSPVSTQGLAELQTEIETLTQFCHPYLVSLIGYCDERNEMILIYEYMDNGTLRSHLYGSDPPTMSWEQRLEVCIAAAKGVAKITDFGLSKKGPTLDETHVSTGVKGSFGYLDPEYFRRKQLTEKSVVYSFGVVLFEVLCARPVIDLSLPREQVNLAEWAINWHKKGQLAQIIDPNLVRKIRPDSLRKFGETADTCLADYGVDRPSMSDVLWNLEYALHLQEAVIQDDPEENSNIRVGKISLHKSLVSVMLMPVLLLLRSRNQIWMIALVVWR